MSLAMVSFSFKEKNMKKQRNKVKAAANGFITFPVFSHQWGHDQR